MIIVFIVIALVVTFILGSFAVGFLVFIFDQLNRRRIAKKARRIGK